MSEHCGFKPFQDCNCGTECKSAAVRLGKYTKPRPAPCSTTHTQYALVGLFALSAIWLGLCVGNENQKTIDRHNQEQVASK